MESDAHGASDKGKVRLTLLKHDAADTPVNPPSPAIGKSTPLQGSVHVQTEALIISLPEGAGVTPSMTKAGIISVPGVEDSIGVAPGRGQRHHPHRVTPLEIVVYFEDKNGIDLSVEDGQHAEAGELFEIIMDEMGFPAVARDIFSLWLVSDLLELQLKSNQIPFKLVLYWEELLEKYTTTSQVDAERDEPVVVFRRNVFCSRVKDMKLEHPDLLRLLYAEAKENIIDARYPISQADCDMLAGIQALIEQNGYMNDTHTPEYYRSKLSDYYPEHFCKRKAKFPWQSAVTNPEHRLAESHKKAYRTYGPIVRKEEKKVYYKAYLDYCWKLPYYGAAFFRGQIEHPAGKLRLMSMTDDPVFVAINTEGVFVIDLDDVQFLMGLIYEELKWEFALPKNPDDRNCMPCLFLQFSANDDGRTCTKVLQIFSRQGMLMDGLISACIKLKRQGRAEDQLDGCQLDTTDGKQDGIIQSGGETWMKFNRLCLTTFDCNGKRLKTSARIPKGH